MQGSRKMPSVLFVIDGLDFGGGERVFLQIASAIGNRCRVAFACNGSGETARKLHERGIPCYPVDLGNRFSWKPVGQLARIVRELPVDVIHTQGARADFFGRLAGWKCATPVLCTVAMPVEGFDVGWVRKKVYRFFDFLTEQRVDKFLVVSDRLVETLRKRRRMRPERVVRIYNGVELDAFDPRLSGRPFRQELGIGEDTFLVGAVGRMVWQKGFEYLVRAIPAILQDKPGTCFVFVGDGPLLQDLERIAEGLSLGQSVRFCRFREDVAHVLAALDLLALPSLCEGFPMVTLEAMAMAKPIVATGIDGVTEQIDSGVNGLLVPPGDSEALAAAVVELAADRSRAEAMGKAARKKVEQRFSVETMVKETLAVYNGIFERRS